MYLHCSTTNEKNINFYTATGLCPQRPMDRLPERPLLIKPVFIQIAQAQIHFLATAAEEAGEQTIKQPLTLSIFGVRASESQE